MLILLGRGLMLAGMGMVLSGMIQRAFDWLVVWLCIRFLWLSLLFCFSRKARAEHVGIGPAYTPRFFNHSTLHAE